MTSRFVQCLNSRSQWPSVDSGATTLGIHYRGTDKIVDHGQRGVSAFIHAARTVSRPDSVIYVATDVQYALDRFIDEFPGRVLSLNMYRESNTSTTSLHRSGKGNTDDAFMDMLHLSRTDFLIKGRSSLSDTALLMSPRVLPFMFI